MQGAKETVRRLDCRDGQPAAIDAHCELIHACVRVADCVHAQIASFDCWTATGARNWPETTRSAVLTRIGCRWRLMQRQTPKLLRRFTDPWYGSANPL